ncbi:hypothetical protein ABT346_05045 [Micromonospora peucetia]|uniref:hypothetical protein n=1 Tax=Micromonospora peucetia TaxID=47871 RepID=UPI00331C85F0
MGRFTAFGRAAIRGRAPWAVTAGALSSVGNLLLSLTVARTESIDGLGRFALAFSLYVLATGLSRATVVEAVLADPDPASVPAAAERTVTLGLGCAVLILAGGFATGSAYLVVTAVALPGLMLHDHVKTVGLGLGMPRPACLREALWTASSGVGVLLGLLGVIGPVAVFAVWAGTGALLGWAAAATYRYRITPGWRLDRAESRAAASFGMQFLFTTGSAQLAVAALGASAGMAVVGAVSLGRTALGPATLLVGTASSLIIPYLAGTRAAPGPVRLRAAVRACVLLSGAVLPPAVLVLLLPAGLGAAVFGSNWRHAAPLMPLLALEVLLSGLALVGFAGHRVHGAGFRALLLGGVLGVIRVPVVVAGGLLLGAAGAAVALLLMALLSAVVWGISYAALVRGTRPVGRHRIGTAHRSPPTGKPADPAARRTVSPGSR